jgi:aminoglycoside 6-adenylyltransferase
MRTEKQMMDLILGFARSDDRVRAVTMCGSRMNPNAPKDEFQDYDIVYVVDDVDSFTCDHDWIKAFGNPIMVQMPEQYKGAFNDGRFIYLMLFDDGNRIDLSLLPIDKFDKLYAPDSLDKVLLDKDLIIPDLPSPSDSDYNIKHPTKKLYNGYCNNFWWVLQNVAKGIMRDELGYAMSMLGYCRESLDAVLSWYIAIDYGFDVSVGKFGKYFKRYLDKDIYNMYHKTYTDSDYKKCGMQYI